MFFLELSTVIHFPPNITVLHFIVRFYTAVARTAFKGDNDQSLLHFWYVCYILVWVYSILIWVNSC